MATTTKIIHDGRIMATVSACLLSRVHTRRGEIVELEYDPNGLHTREFWDNFQSYFDPEEIDTLILCGITYDELNPARCETNLRDIAASVNLIVWSHRWPDGFALSPNVPQVHVPQYHFYTKFRSEISDAELTLFRLAQIIYRDLPTDQISREERVAARGLDDLFESSPLDVFEKLRDGDAEQLLQYLQFRGTSLANERDPEPAISATHSITPILSFDLADESQGREENHITRHARQQELAPCGIAVATRFFGDTHRIYVTRPLADGSLPSVEWLLETAEDDTVSRLQWLGPQDAKHVRLADGTDDRDKIMLRDAIVEEAKRAQERQEGERRPPAGLACFIHEVATSALQNLDLLGSYTRDPIAIRFVPSGTRLLLDVGDRTGLRRSTLVLRLDIHSVDAAAFLFGNGAYNLQKLERVLEGSLLGLHAGASSWVGSAAPPKRVRVDAHLLDTETIDALPTALRDSSTKGIQVDEAINRGAISATSRIGRALADLRIDTLVVFAQSETIGPSVPYAILTAELCRELANAVARNPGRFEVLDLFAGSGVTARVLLADVPNVHVVSVDLMIRSSDVGIGDVPGVTWLTTDARSVVGDRGLMDRRFNLVCMDPPHALLLDLVFGREAHEATLLSRVAVVSDWLVMYVGHATQQGRLAVVDQLASQHFPHRTWCQIGQEVIMIGARVATCDGQHFQELITSVMHVATTRLAERGWRVRRLHSP